MAVTKAGVSPIKLEHEDGCTEYWVQHLLCALLYSLQPKNPNVLELGGFLGHTSIQLASTIINLGGGTLTIAEYDAEAPERAQKVTDLLLMAGLDDVLSWRVLQSDALQVIAQCADESLDFVFVDDDHSEAHVAEEIAALIPKMRIGGLICFHDVYGSCNLAPLVERAGGYCLDLPRLGPAGGLGILQIR